MSVAILGTRGIPARYGGFETFAEEIGVHLAQRGAEVTVYCEEFCNVPAAESYKGVQLIYVSAPKLGPLSTILFDFNCLLAAKGKHDVVYMLGYGASLFCFLPRIWGKRVWINMDGIEWSRSKWSLPARIWLRVMEAVAMWTPNRIIADALSIREDLSRRYRRMPACSVIPYGAPIIDQADAALLADWGLSEDGYYLVVCRLEPENHVLEILQGYAASRGARPLVVVGDHTVGTRYARQLLEIKDPRIRLVGTVYDQSKLQALRFFARAYFHGHSVGGTNPSLLEALGCGNAVIAHDNPFNREVAGTAACYFNSALDIPDLVRRIEADATLRASMRVSAREIVSTRYTWELVTESYIRLLAEDVRSKGRLSDRA